ncbi:hypothetical protein F4780DRAFT_719316 [Xylariomycetidae sp. FL0641]|nr:hypothetical protein F4780DRAFT_719316 [Xylariomycetidae sp. FL0641]
MSPADVQSLFTDHKGVIIPLSIDGYWALIHCVSPTGATSPYKTTLVNPSGKEGMTERAAAIASNFLNIVSSVGGTPTRLVELKAEKEQTVDEMNSGIRMILDALSMTKTGKPHAGRMLEETYRT